MKNLLNIYFSGSDRVIHPVQFYCESKLKSIDSMSGFYRNVLYPEFNNSAYNSETMTQQHMQKYLNDYVYNNSGSESK